ncbi:MAG: hypothetical protein Q4C64_01915 [Erysipelotrichia bacterium]|nr:hypothetical protein [Erysipelotrichia bacterium]
MSSTIKRIIVLLSVTLFLLSGCAQDDNKSIDNDKTITPKAVVYGAAMNDAQIICHVEEGTIADVLAYKLTDDRSGWTRSFGMINNVLNELDYITIKNNYSVNYRPKILTIYAGQHVEASEISGYRTSHNMVIYAHNFSIESKDETYDMIYENYPNINGSFVYFDNYEFAYDKEQIIGYQVLAEKPIDDNFCQQLAKLTMSDLTNLPDEDVYGYYQLFMITLNFHRSVN